MSLSLTEKMDHGQGFWVNALLGQSANECIHHCVLPLKMCTLLPTWNQLKNGGYINNVPADTVKSNLRCCICNKNVEGARVGYGIRIAIAKSGADPFNYHYGLCSASFCVACSQPALLMASNNEMLILVQVTLETIARDISLACIHMDMTGLQFVDCMLSRFKTQYSLLMRQLGKLKSTCAHCGKPGAKRICSGCNHFRYCDETCSHAHWHERHVDECAALEAGSLYFKPVEFQ
jgi:ligand-binding sensor protein